MGSKAKNLERPSPLCETETKIIHKLELLWNNILWRGMCIRKKKDVYPSEMLLQSWRLFIVLSIIIPILSYEIILFSFN